MPRPLIITEQRLEEVKAHVKSGGLAQEKAKEWGVTPSAITLAMQRHLRKITSKKVTEAALKATNKLVMAIDAADPSNPEDRDFLEKIGPKMLDRDGLGPNGSGINISNQIQIAPILASGEAEGLKTLLRGND